MIESKKKQHEELAPSSSPLCSSDTDQDQENLIDPAVDVIYCDICSIPPEYCMYGPSAAKCKAWLAETHPDMYSRIYRDEGLPAQKKEKAERGDDSTLTMIDAMENLKTTDDTAQVKPSATQHHQTRGGVALPRDPSAQEEKERKKRASHRITIRLHSRTKRKVITSVRGLEPFLPCIGLDNNFMSAAASTPISSTAVGSWDLKKVSKIWSTMFACGVGVGDVGTGPGAVQEIVIQGERAEEAKDWLLKNVRELQEKQVEIIHDTK